MSSVNVTAVTCLDNPARFTNPFQFEIYYECLRPLPKGASASSQARAPAQLPRDSAGDRDCGSG